MKFFNVAIKSEIADSAEMIYTASASVSKEQIENMRVFFEEDFAFKQLEKTLSTEIARQKQKILLEKMREVGTPPVEKSWGWFWDKSVKTTEEQFVKDLLEVGKDKDFAVVGFRLGAIIKNSEDFVLEKPTHVDEPIYKLGRIGNITVYINSIMDFDSDEVIFGNFVTESCSDYVLFKETPLNFRIENFADSHKCFSSFYYSVEEIGNPENNYLVKKFKLKSE